MPNEYIAVVVIILVLLLIYYRFGSSVPVTKKSEPLHENFSPYASILNNNVYRSDASFDSPLSKAEFEISGNYLDLSSGIPERENR